MNRRVAITGMGIYSSIGKNLAEVTESLYNGQSGIVLDDNRKTMGFRSGLTGYLKVPDLKGLVSRNQRVCMAEQDKYAYMAASEALSGAKIDPDYAASHEIGILFGNDSSSEAVMRTIDTMREAGDTTMIGSGGIFQAMNSTVSMNLSCIFKLRGISLTIASACASSSHAIGLGSYLIASGLQDCVVCGGAQEVNPYGVCSFDAINAFSLREDAPRKASRPFDSGRDELVPSGGAAVIVLEDYETAVGRGAAILAEVCGYGFSSNGDHISVPSVDGPLRSMQMAVRSAGIEIRDIGYVNAHATSTLVGDRNEAKALCRLLGDHKVEVTSTKSMTGHEMWMAGASEAVYSVLMMQNGFIAPNINLENPDEDARLLNIPPERVTKTFDVVLSNSFGFGGTNSTLIIKRASA